MTQGKKKISSKTRLGIRAAMTHKKMSPDRVHVLSRDNRWAVKREGSQRAYRIYGKKEDAIREGKSLLASKAARSLIVHNKDGKIADWENRRKISKK